MSLLSIPTAPLLGVVAPHMGSSAEEGPTLPSSSVRVCLYVSSSDPPSAPPMVTPSREEAVGWSFAPRGEDTLEDPSMHNHYMMALINHLQDVGNLIGRLSMDYVTLRAQVRDPEEKKTVE
ncbi:hypothetical protein BHM03_00032296 [Ensete ventricosum]|nr:hypothetical protein BHM03_00032296 [Ensete ventricosum]